MRFNMKYGMFTQEGDLLVFGIVGAAKEMMTRLGTTQGDAYDFVERKLQILANAEPFSEATDTAVLEAVYNEIYGAQ